MENSIYTSKYCTERGMKLFEAWALAMLQCKTKRMGVELCGCNNRTAVLFDATKKRLKLFFTDTREYFKRRKTVEPSAFFEERRGESDAEHVYGLEILFRLISYYYPEVISQKDLPKYLCAAQYHEFGESLGGGDVCDDGTRDGVTLDVKEFNLLGGYLREYIPESFASDVVEILHAAFFKKNSKFGGTFHYGDKTEAILKNFLNELMGRPGSMSWRLEHFSNLKPSKKVDGPPKTDVDCIAITKSDLPADDWFCHLLFSDGKIFEYRFAPVFLEIVRSAAEVTRRTDFYKKFRKESDTNSFFQHVLSAGAGYNNPYNESGMPWFDKLECSFTFGRRTFSDDI